MNSTTNSAPHSIADHDDIPDGWIRAQLHGGGHDGQVVTVPETEDKLTFTHHGRAVDYFRPGAKPDFYTIDELRRTVGGGK